MKKEFLTVGAAALGVCLLASVGRAQDAPPAPPAAPPVVQPQPGAQPAPPAVVTPAPPPAAPLVGGVRSVMVFPFENAANPMPPPSFSLVEMGQQVADVVREGM